MSLKSSVRAVCWNNTNHQDYYLSGVSMYDMRLFFSFCLNAVYSVSVLLQMQSRAWIFSFKKITAQQSCAPAHMMLNQRLFSNRRVCLGRQVIVEPVAVIGGRDCRGRLSAGGETGVRNCPWRAKSAKSKVWIVSDIWLLMMRGHAVCTYWLLFRAGLSGAAC